MPPKVDLAAQEAALRARKAARQAALYSRPKIEQAMAAAAPVRDEAAARSAAAMAALRGQVSAEDVQKLVRRQERRSRTGRKLKVCAVLTVLAGGAFAAWKWWDKQANPDWLVEPPAATEVPADSPARLRGRHRARRTRPRGTGQAGRPGRDRPGRRALSPVRPCRGASAEAAGAPPCHRLAYAAIAGFMKRLTGVSTNRWDSTDSATHSA